MPKFLIIRLSSIGDIVLTTPVVRCLKRQMPESEIHYLTKPAFSTILESNPNIHRVHLLDKPLLEKVQELRQEGFDYIIDLHHNLRTLIIKTLLDIPVFSFRKLNIEKSLLVHLNMNILPDIHIVDRYLNTLRDFNIVNDGLGLDYFLPAEFRLNPEVRLPDQFLAFAIGAQHYTKRMPNEKIIEVCKKVDLPVILLGGKDDTGNGQVIAQQGGDHVTNLCGRLSLNESAYVLSKSLKVITHDTGLMHIAAAFKKDIISIWGNTVPEFGMTPYYGQNKIKSDTKGTLIEVQNLRCRPCSKIGFTECPKKHFNCMMQQNISEIVIAATEFNHS